MSLEKINSQEQKPGITDAGKNRLDSLKKNITQAKNKVSNWFSKGLSIFGSGVEKAAIGVLSTPEIAKAGVEKYKELDQHTDTLAHDAGESLGYKMAQNYDTTKTFVTETVNAGVDNVSSAYNEAKETVLGIKQDLSEIYQAGKEEISENVTEAKEFVGQKIESAKEWTNTKKQEALELAKNKQEQIIAWKDDKAEIITGMALLAKDFSVEKKQELLQKVETGWSKLAQMGSNLVNAAEIKSQNFIDKARARANALKLAQLELQMSLATTVEDRARQKNEALRAKINGINSLAQVA